MTDSGTETEGITPCKERSVGTGVCRPGAAMYPLSAVPLETCSIWDESGFWPPGYLALGVELLHHLGMAEDAGDDAFRTLAYEMLARMQDPCTSREECVITDQEEMIRTAIAYGVPVAGRRLEDVARAIARAIIADYLPDQRSP